MPKQTAGDNLNSDENVSHVYHHNDDPGPKVAIKVEKNSKGYNWEITVSNCHSVDEALHFQDDAVAKKQEKYGAVIPAQ